MNNRFLIVLVLALAVGGSTFVVWSTNANNCEILARLEKGPRGDFLVIGEAPNWWDGWMVTLCWRKDHGPWLEYYLDHKAPLRHDMVLSLRGRLRRHKAREENNWKARPR